MGLSSNACILFGSARASHPRRRSVLCVTTRYARSCHLHYETSHDHTQMHLPTKHIPKNMKCTPCYQKRNNLLAHQLTQDVQAKSHKSSTLTDATATGRAARRSHQNIFTHAEPVKPQVHSSMMTPSSSLTSANSLTTFGCVSPIMAFSFRGHSSKAQTQFLQRKRSWSSWPVHGTLASFTAALQQLTKGILSHRAELDAHFFLIWRKSEKICMKCKHPLGPLACFMQCLSRLMWWRPRLGTPCHTRCFRNRAGRQRKRPT